MCVVWSVMTHWSCLQQVCNSDSWWRCSYFFFTTCLQEVFVSRKYLTSVNIWKSMNFLMASHQQYAPDTAKEIQTSAVNTSHISTQLSCIRRYTKTLLLGFSIFSGHVLSFYVEIVTSDHLEEENNHLFYTFQDLWMTTIQDTCDK